MSSAPTTDQEIPTALLDPGEGKPAVRPSQRVGTLLRRTREAQHMELAEVASALRIRAPYLEAMEDGHYERLPGPTYAVGFVRAYAVYLGLDGEEAVRRFKREAEGFDGQRDLRVPVALVERSIPGGPILVAALVLAVCGYGLWYYLTSSTRPRTELVGAVPQSLVKQTDSKPDSNGGANPPADTASANGAGATASASPASGTTPNANGAGSGLAGVSPVSPANPASPPPTAMSANSASPVPAPSSVGATMAMSAPPTAAVPAKPDAAVVPPKTDSDHVFGATEGPARVIVTAKADAWVAVKDKNDKNVFSRLMHAGDVYRAPDRLGLMLHTGNGAGIAIAVDGHDIQLTGNGKVRNVSLDPSKLMASAGPAAAH